MTMDMGKYERAYVRANLADESRMERIVDRTHQKVGRNTNYLKVKPHVTIVPPFYYRENSVGRLREIVSQVDLDGEPIDFTGFSVWKDITKPNYLMLNVDADIRDTQIGLVDSIRESGGQYMKTPVSPHMTLLKSDKKFREPTNTVKRRIQNCVSEFSSVESTQISELEVVVG